MAVITSITPVNYNGAAVGAAVTSIANPSKYEVLISDVLSSSSGENEAGVTNRMKLGERITLNLGWSMLTTLETKGVLAAFAHEYVLVTFLNPLAGTDTTYVFTVEDRTAPLFNVVTGYWEGIGLSLKQQGMVSNIIASIIQATASSEVIPPVITIS